MSVDARAVRTALLAIENHVRQMRETKKLSIKEIASLLYEYSNARNDFTRIMSREKVTLDLRYLPPISETRFFYNVDALNANLREIEIECLKGAEALTGIIVEVSKEELDRLESLREELKNVSAKIDDINYEKNVTQAIDEYVKGHVLASALISSRVTRRILDGVPGENDEKKVTFLVDRGILEKNRKDIHGSLLKSSRLARNVLSHRIDVFPSSAEALSLLADTIRLLPITVKRALEE